MAETALVQSRAEIIKRPPARRFASTVAYDGEYQCDIMFLPYADSADYVKANDGYTCLLLVLEIMTRFAYARPMRGKSGAEVLAAFTFVVDHVRNVEKREFIQIFHDEGSEFCNHAFVEYLQTAGIKQRIKDPADKYSLGSVNSLCRTLRRWIEDWQVENESLAWRGALDAIVDEYNKHEVEIRTRPLNVHGPRVYATPEDIRKFPILHEKVRSADISRGKPGVALAETFNVGDHVRVRLRPGEQPRSVSRLAHPGDLAKGREAWSHRVYNIVSKTRLSFTLHDSTGTPAARTYRAYDLSKVGADSVDVPDILVKVAAQDRRKRRAKKEGL